MAHSILVVGLLLSGKAAAQSLTMSRNNLTINEGEIATYTVVLDSEPTEDVTVTVTAADYSSLCDAADGASCTRKSGVATVDKTSLTFTTSNYSAAQTVTVTATDEVMAGVFKYAKITHQVSGGGNSAVVNVTVLDDDRRGVTHYQVANDGTVGIQDAAVPLWERQGEWGFYLSLNSESAATT